MSEPQSIRAGLPASVPDIGSAHVHVALMHLAGNISLYDAYCAFSRLDSARIPDMRWLPETGPLRATDAEIQAMAPDVLMTYRQERPRRKWAEDRNAEHLACLAHLWCWALAIDPDPDLRLRIEGKVMAYRTDAVAGWHRHRDVHVDGRCDKALCPWCDWDGASKARLQPIESADDV